MAVLIFLKDLLVATISQMVTLFAAVFVLGLLIQFYSQLTFKTLERAFGNIGTYFVAWLGTPIHELGHLLFCWIFMHRVTNVEFFNPDPVSGTLGYVEHKWTRHNPWQEVGNFFIGIGPVVFGCGILFALFYFLIPDSYQAWESILVSVGRVDVGASFWKGYPAVIADSSFVMVRLVFNPENISSWRVWAFIYLSYCVSTNIRLSLLDLKGALAGAIYVVLPFLLLNLTGMLTGLDTARVFAVGAPAFGIIYSLMLLALIVAAGGAIITYIIAASFFWFRYRYILRPF